MSSYHKVYNWLWFNNGYHAEHHFRPKMHWSEMPKFHEKIRQEQEASRVRVMTPPRALGFLATPLQFASRRATRSEVYDDSLDRSRAAIRHIP